MATLLPVFAEFERAVLRERVRARLVMRGRTASVSADLLPMPCRPIRSANHTTPA
jgi:hypothetical protein